MKASQRYRDVIVVGAGAAGVGVSVTLKHVGVKNFVVLERSEVGASFRRWPRQMRFISPSFPSNSVGVLDLNAVAIGTSPAYSLGCEHPTGEQYARYLKAVADYFELPVRLGVDLQRLEYVAAEDMFHLQTKQGTWRCRFVIWAAGEFQYPRLVTFPGAELGIHNAAVSSWTDWPGEEAVIIGGYESGIDAAVHLVQSGRRAIVLERRPLWDSKESDPSVTLSPFTRERLEAALATGRLQLCGGVEVKKIERVASGFAVMGNDGSRYITSSPPILAVGFEGSHRMLAGLVEPRPDGFPLLTDSDESTCVPGLFLVGPMLRHGNHVFCFIYKFRQRFAVVVQTVCNRLGLDASPLEEYRRWGMFLDDLSCCGQECVC